MNKGKIRTYPVYCKTNDMRGRAQIYKLIVEISHEELFTDSIALGTTGAVF